MANDDNVTRRSNGEASSGQRQGSQSGGRGFAGMDSERQRQIASKGGQSVPSGERSFSKDRDLASRAGSIGGQNSHGGRRGQPEGNTETDDYTGSATGNRETNINNW